MPNKTTGQKSGRINVKKLKANPKELTAKEQKKLKGRLATSELNSASKLFGKGEGLYGRNPNHNEALVLDSTI